MNLLNSGNHKTSKGEARGYITYGLHLAPANLSGQNVCPNASKGCAEACLNTAGRGTMNGVQQARIRKTKEWFEDKYEFVSRLTQDVTRGINRALKKNINACFRLNLTSDIHWENYGIIEKFPDYQFYDYTKSIKRMQRFLTNQLPANYHLTFSRSEETNLNIIKAIVTIGGNVAVVFDQLPKEWEGMEVINGDLDDLRFKDPCGKIVGLQAKGKAKHDESGFVVKI